MQKLLGEILSHLDTQKIVNSYFQRRGLAVVLPLDFLKQSPPAEVKHSVSLFPIKRSCTVVLKAPQLKKNHILCVIR